MTAFYVGWEVFKRNGSPDLFDAVQLLLGCLAAQGAIKLSVLAVGPAEIPTLNDEERGYMLLGSFAVIWVSVATIAKVFKRGPSVAENELVKVVDG